MKHNWNVYLSLAVAVAWTTSLNSVSAQVPNSRRPSQVPPPPPSANGGRNFSPGQAPPGFNRNNGATPAEHGGGSSGAPSDEQSPGFVSKKTGKKLSKAEIEDITNENFPDMIESFDYPNAEISDVVK